MSENRQSEVLVSIAETAELLGVCTRTVRRMIDDGKLPAIRFGRRLVRVKLVDVRQLIQDHQEIAQ